MACFARFLALRLAVVLCVSLLIVTTAIAQTLPRPPSERVQVFANCVGRLSALMEHQWMFDGPASEDTARVRRNLISLLQAVMPRDEIQANEVLHWRIEAKLAQARLLQRAAFASDPRVARHAHSIALRYLNQCRGLVLG